MVSRTRYLKPQFHDDITLGEVSVYARFLYSGMWCYMDRQGVIEANARFIKSRVFPYDDMTAAQVEAFLGELVSIKRLFIVEWQNKKFYFCPSFQKHQLFHKDEKPRYRIPRPVLEAAISPVPVQCDSGTSTVQAPNNSGVFHTVNCELVIGNDQRGTENEERETSARPPPEELGPVDELKETPGNELLAEVPHRVQRAWISAFGLDIVKNVLPEANSRWASDAERARFGRLPVFLHHYFSNEKKDRARASPPAGNDLNWDWLEKKGAG